MSDTETVTGEVVDQWDSGHSLPRQVRMRNKNMDFESEYKLVRVSDDE